MREPAAFLLGIALLLLLFGLTRAIRRARLQRRFRSAADAERAAVDLARAYGFRLLDAQPTAKAAILVDGARVEGLVRGDLLLSRWGRRYLGEVKSGQRAPDPRDRHTRRQLFEYAHVFDVDGLLLFDMEAGAIRRIAFPRRRRRGRALGLLVLGFALGAAAGPWLLAKVPGWVDFGP